MFFNSIDFAIFLPIVLVVYWIFKKKIHHQNSILLIASYFFYGSWDWRFLSLIFFSAVIDYSIGLIIHRTEDAIKRKLYLYVSIVANLGFLGFFKYYNFFLENFIELFSFAGISFDSTTLSIILPVGISFYTFQTLSYTIDIYKGRLKPTKDFIAFASFVSFFPQLVAGPIERASNLLPQFSRKRVVTYAKILSGVNDLIWGLFMKVVIADRLAPVVNEIYNYPKEYSGFVLVFGTVLFAFQIYCDFAGYSKIAIGVAKLFDFELMKNFDTPYFSKSLSEFWRRWHISLSTWFRDYVYIPLGGNRTSKTRWYINIFTVFILSGFWHGAQWTFIIWGAIHGLGLIIEASVKYRFKESRLINVLRQFWIFLIICLGWVFFRSNSLSDAFYIIKSIFNPLNYSINSFSLNMIPIEKNTVYPIDVALSIVVILMLLFIEFWIKNKVKFHQMNFAVRTVLYVSGIWLIYVIGAFEKNEFIYFQF